MAPFPLGYEPLEAPLHWLPQLCERAGPAFAAWRPWRAGETCLVRGR